MTSFTANAEAAKSAGSSSTITKTDKYILKILSAKHTTAQNSQAQFIEFEFLSREKQTAKYCKVNIIKKDGMPSGYGEGLMQSLICLLGLPGIDAQQMTHNGDAGSYYSDLHDKVIGVLLQKSIYTKRDGQEGFNMKPVMFFDPKTGQTFQEKSDNQPAQAIDQRLATMGDEDNRGSYGSASYGSQPSAPSAPSSPPSDESFDFDDDIPF